MCGFCVMADFGRKVPVDSWNVGSLRLYQEIMQKIHTLDATLGQPDCEDPEKRKWLQEMGEMLRSLEHTEVIQDMADVRDQDSRFANPI
jgi:hypothetical protein